MAFPFVALITTVGTAITGLFGVKEKQVEGVVKSVEVLGTAFSETARSDAERTAAASAAITAIYQNGNVVEKIVRPLAGASFLVIILLAAFNVIQPEQYILVKIFDFFEIFLIGYLPLRSIDKWLRDFQITNVLKMLMTQGGK